MRIQIWWCESMRQWRWTIVKTNRPIMKQESGQHSDLKVAMKDIESKVECLMSIP